MLIQPSFGISSISLGKIFPYATTTKKSAFSDLSLSINASSFIFEGVSTGISSSCASSFTGVGLSSPLFLFLSSLVSTRLTSCPAFTRLLRGCSEKSGVPIKTIFILHLPLLHTFFQAPHCLSVHPLRGLHTALRQDVHTHDRWLLQAIPLPLWCTHSYQDQMPLQPHD